MSNKSNKFDCLFEGIEVRQSIINEPLEPPPLTAREIAQRRWFKEEKHERE
jgi:hypothetical protein